MREMIRIPVFHKRFLFNHRIDQREWNSLYPGEKWNPKSFFLRWLRDSNIINKDIPDIRWIDQNWMAEEDGPGRAVGQIYDPIAKNELLRVLTFESCAYCGGKMVRIDDDHLTYACYNCFYWAGIGSREDDGLALGRGCLGRLKFIDNPNEVNLNILINYLSNNIERIYDLTPRQAEIIVPQILSDYLSCEVKAFGGTKDKGIDALAIRSDDCKTIVQIKWREVEKKNKSESVSVVREVGGTLLARNIPNGIIITTRKKYSPDAINEAKLISQIDTVNMGRINMELKDFNDLIDMFEVSAITRKEKISIEELTGRESYRFFEFW